MPDLPDSNERNPADRHSVPRHSGSTPRLLSRDDRLPSLTNMLSPPVQTSSRPRDVGGSFASRRGHAAQLSISDPSHHVTEAIGTLYGDDDDGYSDSEGRPVSFAAQPYDDHQQQRQADKQQYQQQPQQQHQQQYGRKPPPEPPEDPRRTLVRSTSDKTPTTLSTTSSSNNDRGDLKKSHTLPSRIPSQRKPTYEGPKSPMSPLSPSLRDVQADKSGSQFPLTHMDNPNDIAQELHNLQALRRMSMDVGNTSDPDLLPFSSMSLTAIPSTAPQGDDDEGDPSRLLWVPARVHPELDTNAFKSFLENRVQAMKRRSGESMLSADGSISNTSSLRRKKSMLSRQIDSSGGNAADDYVDGAERLQRKGSQNIPPIPEVSLDELVKDPSKVVQKLARESQQGQDGTASESGVDSDIILPSAPGMGLRRSTRTTYRKGGSLRGERVPFSKRIAERKAAEPEETSALPPVPAMPSAPAAPPGHGLTRVQSEPVAENFSRPSRSVRRQQNFSREAPAALSHPASELTPQEQQDYNDYSETYSEDAPAAEPQPKPQQLPYRTSSALAQRATPVPQIVETPPPQEETSPPSPTEPVQQPPARPFPERSSSQKVAQQMYSAQPEEPPARSNKRPTPGRPPQTSPPPSQPQAKEQSGNATPGQTLTDMANHPSPLPGGGATRTDSLTFIPTVNASEDKKLEKKYKDKDADTESISSNKSSGWPKWFKSEDKEKKKKEKEKEEQAKKAKGKGGDKTHDNARLDVLQSSIDNVVAKGRESLLLDRESIDTKLTEERKKESARKTSESKKEKEGFFGGLFGGSKKKGGDKEPGGSKKKDSLRALSPEPPSRPLRPDIDFPWSRFTIIEERAIYRMAHIKLANPRRSLHSQVLLSNFMYSYLAKVQAMHPQIQVPVSPQQKRLEEERKRKEAEEQRRRMEEQQRREQQQAQGQDGNFDFEYHRVSIRTLDS